MPDDPFGRAFKKNLCVKRMVCKFSIESRQFIKLDKVGLVTKYYLLVYGTENIIIAGPTFGILQVDLKCWSAPDGAL
jgi:hypothetical protein